MLNRLIRLVGAPCVVLMAAACAPQDDSENPAENSVGEIINITGDLFLGRDGMHNTVFLVTPEGIILADPIGVDFAQWLRTVLEDRFESTVKYVIYSHHHPEHATGGNVFADTATFVGHENLVTALSAPFPSNAAKMDLNANGSIERSESCPWYCGDFDKYDRNGDDRITGVEINADTPPPDIVYSTRMSITLGGSRVELMHPGPAHTYDMTVLLFPDQRVVFSVDFLNINNVPPSLAGYSVGQYVDASARVQDLDFDILIPGHGEVGEKTDLILFPDFLQALEAAVASGIAEGRSVDEMRENLSFPDYEDWAPSLRDEARRFILITEVYELLVGS